MAQLGKGSYTPQVFSATGSSGGMAGAAAAADAALCQGKFAHSLNIEAAERSSPTALDGLYSGFRGASEAVTEAWPGQDMLQVLANPGNALWLPDSAASACCWCTVAGAEGAAARRAVRGHTCPHDVAAMHQQPAAVHASPTQPWRHAGVYPHAQDTAHAAAGVSAQQRVIFTPCLTRHI